jgi:hypothetical protein
MEVQQYEGNGSPASSVDFYGESNNEVVDTADNTAAAAFAAEVHRAGADDSPQKRKREELESLGEKKRRVDDDFPSPIDRSTTVSAKPVQSTQPSAPTTHHAIRSSAVRRTPPEIWQAIFCYLDPTTLKSVSQVNHPFRTYVLEAQEGPPTAAHSIYPVKSAESIWANSRRQHYPHMPRPLSGWDEWEMWNLVTGQKCQFCGEGQRIPSDGQNIWEAGPGENGVRVIWPFGIRTCGKCLQEKVEKVSLLTSTLP